MHRPEVSEETKPEQQTCHVFRERHYAEVPLFDCTTQHSYCCPASTPNASHFQALFQNLNKTPKVAKDLKSWQKPQV